MKKFSVFVVVLMMSAQLTAGHPGPNRIPTDQEISDSTSHQNNSLVVQEVIDEVIVYVDDQIQNKVEQIIAQHLNTNVTKPISEMKQGIEDLRDRIKELSKNENTQNLWKLAGIIALSLAALIGWIEWRLRSLRKRLFKVDNSTTKKKKVDPLVKPRKSKEKKNNELATDARIVTHTRKTEDGTKVTELYNLNVKEEWSPRSADAVINDIRTLNLMYLTQDASGNQAKIIVRKSKNNLAYLTTEADEHETNNLLNLPDPP